MRFANDFYEVTRENHWQIASLVTQNSLFTVTHALFFISLRNLFARRWFQIHFWPDVVIKNVGLDLSKFCDSSRVNINICAIKACQPSSNPQLFCFVSFSSEPLYWCVHFENWSQWEHSYQILLHDFFISFVSSLAGKVMTTCSFQ